MDPRDAAPPLPRPDRRRLSRAAAAALLVAGLGPMAMTACATPAPALPLVLTLDDGPMLAPMAQRPQVLLVHDHPPMALWLQDVIALMHTLGFAFVEPERAWPTE